MLYSVIDRGGHLADTYSKMKAKIGDLPSGVGVNRTMSGRGREFWRIRLGKRFTGGPVIKRDFSNLAEARKWIFGDAQKEKLHVVPLVELKQSSGASAFAFSPSQLGEAMSAFQRVEKWKMSLTHALDLAERYLAPEVGAMSLEKAIEKCAEEKGQLSRSPQTLYDLRTRWKRFHEFLPSAKRAAVHAITTDDVARFIKKCKLGPVAQRNMVRGLSSLFSWCVANKVMPENPALRWDFSEAKKVLSKDREPRIVTIAEAEKLLRIALAGHEAPMVLSKQEVTLAAGEMVPFVAVGLFGGLRPFEARRFRWEWVWWGDADTENHEPHLDVPAAITKTGHARHVPIEPVLAEWLLPHKRDFGSLIPSNFERKFAMFSKLCWGKEGWPEDIARHSYASYLLARDKEAGTVAENLGHRDTTATLFRHYRKAVKFKADVLAYWSMTPEKIGRKKTVLQFAA